MPPNITQDALAFLMTKAHCWLTVNLISTRSPRPFLQSCFPAGQSSAYIGARACSSPAAGLLLIYINVLDSPFLCPVRSCWVAAKPSGISAAPSCFLSSENLQMVRPAPLSRSVMKTLIADPWGTLLVTALQLDCNATDHHRLCPAIQPVLSPPSCLLIQPTLQHLLFEKCYRREC